MKKYSSYIPLVGVALVIIIIFVTMYCVVRYVGRTDANIPQIQIAEDGASQLNSNLTPQSLVGSSVDISKSLASFTNVYDPTGRTVTGAGYLDGRIAVPPKGTLLAAKDQPYHSVTWQPKPGVRIAAVVVKAKNYYVLSGRSLAEVEKNQSQVAMLAFAGCLLSLAVAGGTFWARRHFRQPKG